MDTNNDSAGHAKSSVGRSAAAPSPRHAPSTGQPEPASFPERRRRDKNQKRPAHSVPLSARSRSTESIGDFSEDGRWSLTFTVPQRIRNAVKSVAPFFYALPTIFSTFAAFIRRTAIVSFLLAMLCLSLVVTNAICIYAPSTTCVWRKEVAALTAVETDLIGGLVNSSRHGTARAMDLIAARRSVEELRSVGSSSLPEELDGELIKYHNGLYLVSRRLMRVDAGIWALAETVIVLNEATHNTLVKASKPSLWDRIWWHYCGNPSFEVTSRAFNHLRDALAAAVDAALWEATALRSDSQRLTQVTKRFRRLAKDYLGPDRSRDSAETLEDIAAHLWDKLAPWLSPEEYKAHVRRPLAGLHVIQQKSHDFSNVVYKDLQQTKQQIQLIDDLISYTIWPFGGSADSCPLSWSNEPAVFKDLVVSADKLRYWLKRRT